MPSGTMKSGIGLQFSILGKQLARAAAWLAVTMTLGLILAVLFGPPLAASTPIERPSPGEQHFKQKDGPWVYSIYSTPV
jgi:hypothetical protein